MPPAIIFDLGKVLVDFDYSIAARRVAAKSSWRSPPRTSGIISSSSPLLVEYESGRFTRQTCLKRCAEPRVFCGSLEEFGVISRIYSPRCRPPSPSMRNLRQRGFKTYIFSNTNDLAVEHVRRNFPFFSEFRRLHLFL